MATRALIGYLNPDNTITTTYNHYDGYPDSLGKALDRHYSTDDILELGTGEGFCARLRVKYNS